MNLYDTIFQCWHCPVTFMQECRCLVETVFGYGRCDYHLIACHHISFLVAVMHNVGSDRKLTCDTFTWHMKCPALLKVLESQFGRSGSCWHFSLLFLHAGVWAQIVMPQTNMDAIKGQLVVLRASYSTQTNSDPTTHTIIWNFVSNNSQLVRKQTNIYGKHRVYICSYLALYPI